MTDIKKLTDEELLERIKNGDDKAENEIFARYKDLVTKISRGYFIVGGLHLRLSYLSHLRVCEFQFSDDYSKIFSHFKAYNLNL